MAEEIQIRIFGDPSLPTLIYLPGLHGDWTLVTSFRRALKSRARFVEITYPRSLNWSIREYADALETALLAHGIGRGWLLGESFGSQFAWELADRNLPAGTGPPSNNTGTHFKVDGIILAGGFVKHPWKHGPRLLRWIGEKTTQKQYLKELKLFVWYARLRHRRDPETLESFREFAARRTGLDRQAMRARLRLLEEYDPRPIARRVRVPVYYLGGLIDPLVPWVLVRRWLRKNCPGYRFGKTFWLADHNVLAASPARTADLVLQWMSIRPANA